MRDKKVLTAIALAVIAVLFLVWIRPRLQPRNINSVSNISVIDQRAGLPIRIKIPSINLNAEVEQVGLASDGSMDVPKIATNTAWYQAGPRPGEMGSAVIDGHVDQKDGSKAVFADLSKLKSGDKITITDEQGTDILFIVQTKKTYSASADATDIFTSKDGKAHLNLITCSGAWDKTSKNYTQRLVIFADKE